MLAVIGDGDLIMGASSLFSLSGLRPANLLVLVLDDGLYTITGGQSVVAPMLWLRWRRPCPAWTWRSLPAPPTDLGSECVRATGRGARRDRRSRVAGPEPVREAARGAAAFALAVEGRAD